MQHQQHRRHRSLSSNNCEREDDLVLFQELQKKEREASSCDPVQRAPPLKTSGEEDIFSSSEWSQHDYDWLTIPPATSVGHGFTTPSMWSSTSEAISRLGSSNEPPSKVEPSVRAVHRSFESQVSSAAFPTSTSLTSRKSFSSSSSPSAAAHAPSMPGRSTTPVSRPIARPSTPTRSGSGAGIRSSTPTGRSTIPSNPATSAIARPPTPNKRPATPTRANNSSSSSGKVSSSSSKQSAAAFKIASLSRPSSLATSRARQPTAHPAVLGGTIAEQPSNLLVDRPLSNPQGSMALKTGSATAAVKLTLSEPADRGARNKRPSSSPLVTRGRLSSDSQSGHKSSTQRTGKPPDSLKVSITSGTESKMVDKLMPPRKPVIVSQGRVPRAVNPQPVKALKPAPLRDVKSTTLARESTGYGRNLSKKSLDMAIRHMDIRGSNTNSSQSFMSNVPMSSLYSVRSRNGHGNSSSSIASSPMATSSNASSEHGMSLVIDPESSDYFNETSSDMGSRASTISHADSTMAFSTERKVSHWLGSPGYMNDTSADIMQIFEQELASLSSPESPLISQQEGIIDCDEFALEPM